MSYSKKRSSHELRFDVMPNSEIMSGIKRAFTRSVIVDAKYDEQRIEKVRLKLDGTPSKVKDIYYPCNHCKVEFKRPELDCDHVEPVIPVQIPTRHMCWDVVIEERCFVKTLDKLQLLCQPCHIKKSKEETELRKEWRRKEKHIVYLTTCAVNGKRYIGVHKCVNIDDGYIGSGTALTAAIALHGREQFYRKVLFCYDNAKDAYDKEAELVTPEFVAKDTNYNLTPGGNYNWSNGPRAKEYSQRMSEARKGILQPATKLHLEKMWAEKRAAGEYVRIIAVNSKTGERSEQFETIKDCAIALGLDPSSISKVCLGKIGSTNGFTFETEKYGNSTSNLKDDSLKGIVSIRTGGYSVKVNGTYVGFRSTLEEALVLKSENSHVINKSSAYKPRANCKKE